MFDIRIFLISFWSIQFAFEKPFNKLKNYPFVYVSTMGYI